MVADDFNLFSFHWFDYFYRNFDGKIMKIFVRVKPKAKEEKVEKIDDINFNVQVRELPEKGRANMAVIRALAEYFNIGQSNIQIVSGSKSKLKIIEITKQ